MTIDIQKKLQKIDEQRALLLSFHNPNLITKKHFDEHINTEMTYHSNAIEGSTLTLNETKLILQDHITVTGKSVVEHQEAKNHEEAINYIKPLAAKPPYIISEEEILAIHQRLLSGINYEWAGKYRQQPVYIKRQDGSIQEFSTWQIIPDLVKNLLTWVREQESLLHPVLLASELHYRLISIHPFIDGNGRTARLLMNVILLQNGYPLTTIRLEQRQAYLEAIEAARTSGDMEPFYQIHLEALAESLGMAIKTYQENIIWK